MYIFGFRRLFARLVSLIGYSLRVDTRDRGINCRFESQLCGVVG